MEDISRENVKKLAFLILLLLVLCHIQRFVDVPRDRFNLRAEFSLNSVEGESVVVGDQVDGNTKMPKPSTPSDPVKVGLCHLGEVEVDDHVDSLDVYSAREEV